MIYELGWVIERGSEPLYWGGLEHTSRREDCWSPMHLDAVRFMRARDAAQVMYWRGLQDAARIVEHLWTEERGEHSKIALLREAIGPLLGQLIDLGPCACGPGEVCHAHRLAVRILDRMAEVIEHPSVPLPGDPTP